MHSTCSGTCIVVYLELDLYIINVGSALDLDFQRCTEV